MVRQDIHDLLAFLAVARERSFKYYCNARGVDCSQAMGTCRSENHKFDGRGCNANADCGGGVCTLPDSYEEFEYRQCCSGVVPQTVQQRAWTSPIWYTPS